MLSPYDDAIHTIIFISHLISSLAIILNMFGVYLVLRHSSHEMGFYRYFVLSIVVSFFDLSN